MLNFPDGQCQSKVFFPDDPAQTPQFSDCPRRAETERTIRGKGVKLCTVCAKVWDEHEARAKAAGQGE